MAGPTLGSFSSSAYSARSRSVLFDGGFFIDLPPDIPLRAPHNLNRRGSAPGLHEVLSDAPGDRMFTIEYTRSPTPVQSEFRRGTQNPGRQASPIPSPSQL